MTVKVILSDLPVAPCSDDVGGGVGRCLGDGWDRVLRWVGWAPVLEMGGPLSCRWVGPVQEIGGPMSLRWVGPVMVGPLPIMEMGGPLSWRWAPVDGWAPVLEMGPC